MAPTLPWKSPSLRPDTWTNSNLSQRSNVRAEDKPLKEQPKTQQAVKNSELLFSRNYLRWSLTKETAILPLKAVNSTLSSSNISFKRSLSINKTKSYQQSQKSSQLLRPRRPQSRRGHQRNTPIAVLVVKKLQSQTSWLSPSALMCIGSIMQRTCALPATGSSVATKMRSTVSTLIDSSTQWVCARPATCQTTTREGPRLRERPSNSRPRPRRRRLRFLMMRRPVLRSQPTLRRNEILNRSIQMLNSL